MKKSLIFLVAIAILLMFVEQTFSREINGNGKVYILKKMVSQYYTTFNPQNLNRTKNIRIAMKSINGLIIQPGEVISFNELVGPRTKEAGFFEAPSLENGKKVTSVGGGICQIASTWSAATIKMKIKIIERHRHSLPVSYISSKEEAAVVYGIKDFKLKNTSKNVLFVKCFIKNDNRLYVEYWKCKEA